jgi:hypothetical protein
MVLHGKVTPGDFRIREHHVNDVSNKVEFVKILLERIKRSCYR